MNESDRIERLLAETPRPAVVEGAHRERLREELVRAAQPPMIKKEKTMDSSSPTTWKQHLRIAAVLMVCVLLVAAGWAAEKVYRAAKGLQVVSIVESPQRGESPLADPSLWATDPNDAEAKG